MTTKTQTEEHRMRQLALSRWRRYFRDSTGWLQHTVWGLCSLLLVAGISALDYLTGKNIQLFVFFFIPTILAVWKLGLKSGLGFAALCALIGLVLDLWLQRNVFVLFATANAIARFAVFAISAYGAWKIRMMGNVIIELSLTDALTGLNNRRALMLHGKEELDRMERSHDPLSVMYVDLDNFKIVNDTMGHDVGDEVLKITASLLSHRLRRIDFAARLGGDEFAAMLPATDGKGSMDLANQIRTALLEAFSQKNLPVSASIGVATFYHLPDSFEYVLKCADSLMYEIKNSSKNAVLQRDMDVANAIR